jgi:general secretion pathway protein B
MSYILDALRKAERERSLGQVPTIDGLPLASRPVQRRVWPWVLAAALLLNAVVIGGISLFPRDESATDEEQIAEAPPAPSSAPVGEAPPATVPPVEPIESPVAEVAPPPAPEPETVETEPLPETAPEPENVAVDEPAMEAPPEPLPEAPADIGDTPWLRDMPPEFRSSVPELKIDAHFYSEDRKRRFVMVNLQKYREGERLNEGPELEAILPNGLLLSWQGQQFKYPLPR